MIELRSVIKRFGATVALDGFDLRMVPGEVHGFLGPNGAGKRQGVGSAGPMPAAHLVRGVRRSRILAGT